MKFLKVTLFVGVFLFVVLGVGVGQAKAQNLPTVNNNSVTKLLEVGGVYYYAFTSTTLNGDYHLYITTSTDGVVGNWSSPVDVFGYPIKVVDFGSGHPNINFGFDYNSVGAYFGATIAASNTSQIWFTTSTNGSSWSSTSTAVSGYTADENNPILSFSSSENLATIFFKESNNQVNVVYSTNNGGSWTSGTLFNTGDVYSIKGGKVSGSGTSRKFHIGLVKGSSQHDVQYAYSMNDASVWTTTTVDVIYGTVPIVGNFGFDRLVSFDVDGDGLPSFVYYKPVQVGGAGPYDVTSTIVYAHKSSLGSWSTSTLLSDVYFSIIDSSQQPSDLYFFNGNKPIFTGLGSNYGLVALVNTSSSWTAYNLTGGLIGTDSDVSSVYSSSTKNWASSFVLSDGSLKFVTTTLMTDAPTTTSIYPRQVYNPSIANISVTTTVSDTDGSNVNLLVEMSTDGSTWGTTSIYSATASTGSVTTSSGHIYGINTSAGQNNVSFVIGLLPGTGLDGYDGPAYVRITPYDVYYTGVPRVSGSFSVDLAQPTVPGNVSAYSVSTSSIVLNLPTTTSTDSNFSEYKIAYGTSGPDLFFTSSSDPNLANSNFNGAVTTTITGLSPSTTYTFQVYAYDAFGNATSSVGTFSTTTVDYYSGQLPDVSSDAKTKLILANGKYYFAFTSSTSNGNYHLYVVSSTSGVNGTWSRPRDVFNFGISRHKDYNTNTSIDGNFGFDYNAVGGYFGAAIYASGTSQIWFATSTDASSWSATSTIVSGLSTESLASRSVYVYFSKSENLGVIYYDVNSSPSSTVGVSYTTDNCVNWTPGNNLNLNLATLLDGQVSGSGLSRAFHFGYFDETLFSLVYASSTDNGATWTTSTAATGVNGNILGVGDFGFYRATSFGLDDNGLPAFVFLKPILASGSGPYDVTSTLKYTHRNNSGVWQETDLDTIYWSIDSSVQRQTDLIFYNTSKPIFASMGTGLKLIGGSNDSGSWSTSTINSSVVNKYGDVSLVANTSTNIWAAGYALNDGTLHFTTTSLTLVSNTAPSVTNISPSFATDASGLVTVTTTVSDADGDTVTLYVDYSGDGGSSWASSTISTVTGSGTFTTSSGAISGIGSALSGNAISFVWNSQADGVTSTSNAEIRIRPNDGTVNGTTKTSADFVVDNVAPSAPSISGSTVTVSSVAIQWGAVSGVSFYTVSSSAGSTVTTTDTSKSFSGLSASTNYNFQVKATDAYGNASSFSSVYSVSTSANTPAASGGGGSPAPAAPSTPVVVAPAMINQEFSVTGSVEVRVGNVVHKIKVNKIDSINKQANFTVESTPITFTLKVNEEKTLDTDGDKTTDVRVKLNSINTENKTVNLAIVSASDLQFTINHFDLTTASRDVTLYFNSPDAKTMAVSESEDFKGASFEPYAKTKKWKLSAGDGYKKLYVKFRTAQGGVKVVASEIKLVSGGFVEKVAVPESQVISMYIFKRNLSAGSTGSDVKQLQILLKQLGYFTYPKLSNTYGPYTKEAVKKFQKNNNIKPVNGLVGPATRKALNSLE